MSSGSLSCLIRNTSSSRTWYALRDTPGPRTCTHGSYLSIHPVLGLDVGNVCLCLHILHPSGALGTPVPQGRWLSSLSPPHARRRVRRPLEVPLPVVRALENATQPTDANSPKVDHPSVSEIEYVGRNIAAVIQLPAFTSASSAAICPQRSSRVPRTGRSERCSFRKASLQPARERRGRGNRGRQSGQRREEGREVVLTRGGSVPHDCHR